MVSTNGQQEIYQILSPNQQKDGILLFNMFWKMCDSHHFLWSQKKSSPNIWAIKKTHPPRCFSSIPHFRQRPERESLLNIFPGLGTFWSLEGDGWIPSRGSCFSSWFHGLFSCTQNRNKMILIPWFLDPKKACPKCVKEWFQEIHKTEVLVISTISYSGSSFQSSLTYASANSSVDSSTLSCGNFRHPTANLWRIGSLVQSMEVEMATNLGLPFLFPKVALAVSFVTSSLGGGKNIPYIWSTWQEAPRAPKGNSSEPTLVFQVRTVSFWVD